MDCSTMGRPEYNVREVKDLAWRHGWDLLKTPHNDYGRMISFRSDKCGGVRINIYLRTGTVGTALEHHRQGKT